MRFVVIDEEIEIPNSVEISEEKPKYTLQDALSLLVTVTIVIGLDQWTKALVRASLSVGESFPLFPNFLPFIKIVNWYNRGAAFGIFQNSGTIFIVLAFVVSIFIISYYPQVPKEDWAIRIAMGMQMGGALGNAIDRLMRGFVTDFFAVGSFPVFNVADSAISVGAVIFILGVWASEKKLKEETILFNDQSINLEEDNL